MSETVETVATEVEAPAPAAAEPSPAADLRSAISAAFDEAEKAATPEAEAEAPAAQRDERGRFVGHERSTTDVDDHEEASDEPQAPAEAAPEARPEVPQHLAPVAEVLDTYRPLYAARGIAPEQAMRSLFEAQKVLEERPAEAIQVLARQYGVDLRQFAPQPRPETQAPAQAPQTNDPVAVLQRQVEELKQFLATQQQKAVEAENATVEQSIAAFASDPKHSHFPAVRTAMGALMQAGIAKDMESAYEMACRAHPEVWTKIQAAEAEKRAKTDNEARQKAVASARSKAVSVRGAVPVPGNSAVPKDLRSQLLAAWDGRLN